MPFRRALSLDFHQIGLSLMGNRQTPSSLDSRGLSSRVRSTAEMSGAIFFWCSSGSRLGERRRCQNRRNGTVQDLLRAPESFLVGDSSARPNVFSTLPIVQTSISTPRDLPWTRGARGAACGREGETGASRQDCARHAQST